MKAGIFKQDPFASMDQAGVGQLVKMATERDEPHGPTSRSASAENTVEIRSPIKFCHRVGLN